MEPGAATYKNEPTVDRSKAEPIFLMSSSDFWMGVNHPSKLDGREVSGEGKTRAGRIESTERVRIIEGPFTPCPCHVNVGGNDSQLLDTSGSLEHLGSFSRSILNALKLLKANEVVTFKDDALFVKLLLELVHLARCPGVVPDDGVAHRFTRVAVPEEGCLSLIGDAHTFDVVTRVAHVLHLLNRAFNAIEDRLEQINGVVLMPSERSKSKTR